MLHMLQITARHVYVNSTPCMFKIAQKIKKEVAGLLLFSFLNVLTFLPGSHIDLIDADIANYPVSFNFQDEEINRSTILELILENVAGLEDCLPDSEKPDFSYDYFSIKFRCISAFLIDLIAPTPQEDAYKIPLLAEVVRVASDQPEDLPHLQHHNFVFRLTPF